MKIAMLGHKRIPSREGGVEIVVEELSKRMVKLGHEVVCYNRRENRIKTKSNIENIKINDVFTLKGKGISAFSASFFASICASFSNCDVVHYHAEGPALMCFIPKLFKKKVVVTVHGLDWKREKWNTFAASIIKFGEKMAVKHADEIIVLSENIKEYFLDNYGRTTTYIPNGTPTPCRRKANIITKKWGIGENEYILFLGRIVPEKGLDYLLEAYKELNTDKKLVIAGKSGECNSYFNTIYNKACNIENVILAGFVKDEELYELFSNAYIYVLPSDLEGMPISLLEAMSYENCCVVSDIPECTELVEDRAIIFKRGCIKDLHQKLQILCDNELLTASYKKGSSEFINSKCNWDDVVRKTLSLYV